VRYLAVRIAGQQQVIANLVTSMTRGANGRISVGALTVAALRIPLQHHCRTREILIRITRAIFAVFCTGIETEANHFILAGRETAAKSTKWSR